MTTLDELRTVPVTLYFTDATDGRTKTIGTVTRTPMPLIPLLGQARVLLRKNKERFWRHRRTDLQRQIAVDQAIWDAAYQLGADSMAVLCTDTNRVFVAAATDINDAPVLDLYGRPDYRIEQWQVYDGADYGFTMPYSTTRCTPTEIEMLVLNHYPEEVPQ